ncbi:MAG: hypothetical protein KAG61_07555 [Bacteriovoracaceae bacterium]|nr:hypothetical protein [Bacteriovoracaceae bacterium]
MIPHVYSEIGRLKKVMVHAPGPEVDIVTPNGANDLLFEDILFGDLARTEHEIMCKVFHKYGVETCHVLDLLIESLVAAPKDAVYGLVQEIINLEGLGDSVLDKLKGLTLDELGHAFIEGIEHGPKDMTDDNLYILAPIPNLIFARDPVIMCHDKVLATSMAEKVRTREARLMVFIFTNHPELKAPESIIDMSKIGKCDTDKLTLEGGDFLVIDEKTIAIGCSLRTTIDSIKLIGTELSKLGIENLVVPMLPKQVAFIHMDTTFTRISENECLFYPPIYAKDSPTRSDILYFDLTKRPLVEKKYDYIIDCFSDIGIEMNPIYCGGKESLIDQQREQWTQGSNSVCIAPGIILTYSRNVKTIEELAKAGYMCVSAEEVIKPHFNADLNRKTVILLKGEELCRARGGPRCLTHPLFREKL